MYNGAKRDGGVFHVQLLVYSIYSLSSSGMGSRLLRIDR